jgi:hypothetical protein
MENHGGMMSREKTPDSTTRALWQSYQQLSGSKQEEWANDEFCLAKYFCSYLQVIFTCCKILQHRATGFTSPQKKGMLQISIIFKNPLPRPSLNPRTLGLIASMLTITPLRRQYTKHFVDISVDSSL